MNATFQQPDTKTVIILLKCQIAKKGG